MTLHYCCASSAVHLNLFLCSGFSLSFRCDKVDGGLLLHAVGAECAPFFEDFSSVDYSLLARIDAFLFVNQTLQSADSCKWIKLCNECQKARGRSVLTKFSHTLSVSAFSVNDFTKMIMMKASRGAGREVNDGGCRRVDRAQAPRGSDAA